MLNITLNVNKIELKLEAALGALPRDKMKSQHATWCGRSIISSGPAWATQGDDATQKGSRANGQCTCAFLSCNQGGE